MRKRLITSFPLFLSVVIMIIGCAPKTHEIDLPLVEMSEFSSHLETLQTRYDLTESLKTTKMMVTIQEADRKPEELRELLWYKKSEDGGELLHIQALGGFNETKGVAIAKRDQFLLVLLDEQEAYLGELSDGILKKIFGIDLRISDVLSAIFANPFLDGRTEKLKITSSEQKFIITRPGVKEGHTENITVLVQDGEPHVTEWRINDKDGLLHQSVVFEDYREVDGILRPHKVEIERPLEQTRVVVKMTQVQLNIEIDDSRFDFQPFLTEDMEIIPLSELEETDVPE
ncbi:MAG: DUF4292 domain-containing protein [Candidatus Poribacteria bacterium]|nr:DUF4292 domain-containing protein [Candidatus Poribacteria bacterium]